MLRVGVQKEEKGEGGRGGGVDRTGMDGRRDKLRANGTLAKASRFKASLATSSIHHARADEVGEYSTPGPPCQNNVSRGAAAGYCRYYY